MTAQTKKNDPYSILGVSKTASDAEIKKAYRALAKKLHPDINPGDAANEERFKEVSAAFNFLRDSEQRRRFDAGEIDATGAEKPDRSFYRDYADTGARQRYRPESGFDDLSDIFSRAFSQRGGQSQTGAHRMQMRGGDLRYHLQVDFLDAINGGKSRVTTPDGSTLDISIPVGIRDGQTLRLAGRGQPGLNGGPSGDALVEISVKPHAVFTRDGNDILLELPISIDEAVLGASMEVPTTTGRVKLRIPPGSSSGKVLRLKGKGARAGKGAAGDQLVTLKIMLPDKIDDTLKGAMEEWRKTRSVDPRKNWKGRTL